MGEVRVAIIGGAGVFPGLVETLQEGVSMCNDSHGTMHQLGMVAASEGVGASSHVPYPHIIASRARVGSDEHPVSTVETIHRLLEPVRGELAYRAFILDDLQDQVDREELRYNYNQLELAEQVRLFAPYTEENIDRFLVAIMVHLKDVLESFRGA